MNLLHMNQAWTKVRWRRKGKRLQFFSPAAQRCQNFHFVCSLAGGRGEKEAEGKKSRMVFEKKVELSGVKANQKKWHSVEHYLL